MIERIRFTWQLLVLASIIVLLGMLFIPRMDVDLSPTILLVILGSVVVINFVTYLVMSAAIKKNSREGVVFLLAGIGVKFLLYLLFILLYWIATKNLTRPFIITFFALYLFVTFFTAVHLFKLLKNK